MVLITTPVPVDRAGELVVDPDRLHAAITPEHIDRAREHLEVWEAEGVADAMSDDDLRARIVDAVDAVFDFKVEHVGGTRSVTLTNPDLVILNLSTGPAVATGGLSFGDAPTESMGAVRLLSFIGLFDEWLENV